MAPWRIAETGYKRTFELMRGEDRLLKRQPDGEGIDFDALVEGYSDMRTGTELPSLLFTRRRRNDRDLAVMFMVDMSGSTKGWINDAEREALVMLCEAVEALGDRYAIYGFSGVTRRRCEVYRVKRFDEDYGTRVRERIADMLEARSWSVEAARYVAQLAGRMRRNRIRVVLGDRVTVAVSGREPPSKRQRTSARRASASSTANARARWAPSGWAA